MACFEYCMKFLSELFHTFHTHLNFNQEYQDLNQVMIFPIVFLSGNMNFNIIDEIYTNFEFLICSPENLILFFSVK
jgi:hypothetical protein